MRCIAVVNQKGGVGKTTTVVNVAAGLAERGRRVLVVDLDPQGSATRWLGIDGITDEPFRVLVDGEGVEVWESSIQGVDVVPSSSHLGRAERALLGEIGSEVRLRKRLGKLITRYDYVLIDCSPSLGLLTVNALATATEVLAVVEARVMAVHGLAALLSTVEQVREAINPALGIGGILISRVDGRTRLSREVEELIREEFGEQVYRTVIRENVRLAEAPHVRQSILEYAPGSHGAKDYRVLVEEIDG